MGDWHLMAKLRFIWFLALFLTFTKASCAFQSYNDAEVKTALLFHFIKYIEGDSFPKKDTIYLGYIGNDSVFVSLFEKLHKGKINRHFVKVVPTNSNQDLSVFDILFVMYENNYEISSVFKKIRNSQVFLITDRYPNRREIMINFIHVGEKVQFEVNSKNINDQGLRILPKLLVLGGTELDVRKLYSETEKTLQTEQKKVEAFESELESKKAEIENLVSVLSKLHLQNDSLNNILVYQTKQIDTQNKQLIIADSELKNLAIEIENKKNELSQTSSSLRLKNRENNGLDNQLKAKQQTIEKATHELDLLKDEQEKTESILNGLQEQIDFQKSALYIFIAFFLLLGILIFIVYRGLIIKKRQNVELEDRNIQINNQREQILKQAEDLSVSNKQLDQEKQRAEEAFDKLKNAQSQLVAAEKMVSLGQLTSGIAHEINNPINYISSNLEGLKSIIDDFKTLIQKYDELATPEIIAKLSKFKEEIEYNELIVGLDEITTSIKLGVERTKAIVSSLRTFARIEEDNYIFADLCEIINNSIILIGNAKNNQITISKKYASMLEIECIPGKLSQVFINILVNAVQAIQEQGEIEIITDTVEKDGRKYAKIDISDNGMGMSEQVKAKIFEPFFTTKEVGQGTGLGMSITYSIIKKHNGFIEIDSEIGIGTTFTIYLPY